jgi:hypothetical protein
MNQLYAISIVTGDTFKIQQDDVPTLFKYQIPLKKLPKSSCNKCFGRGWESIDPQNGLHHLCKCTTKSFMDGFKISEMVIEMPRLHK